MTSISGFGGAFVRVKDPAALYAWYERHFGLKRTGGTFLLPAPASSAPVVLAFFTPENDYFPKAQPAMLNLRVADLDQVLDHLKAEGVEVDPKRESYDFGRFGWFTDPEGNRVELWQPTAGK